MIRTAVHADVEVVAELERRCLGADAWSPWLVEQGVRGGLPTVHYVVFEHAAAGVVGYACVSIVADIAELQRIAVAPEHRRTGVARTILDAVVSRARAGRADRLLLEVRDDNAGALAFYGAAGFTEIDRRRRYYRDGTTAVVMLRRLRPTA